MSESAAVPTSTTSAATSAPGASPTPTSPLATISPTSPISPSAATTTAAASTPTKLIAVAFYSLEPSTKVHKIRPGVASSLQPLTIIVSSPSTASAHSAPGTVAAFNAATDLVMHLDSQLSHPPSAVETLSGLFRPASAEQGGRLKKMSEKVRSGTMKVPVGKGGEEWAGERSVQEMNWEEFGKVFGS
jgi:hypothetical protein